MTLQFTAWSLVFLAKQMHEQEIKLTFGMVEAESADITPTCPELFPVETIGLFLLFSFFMVKANCLLKGETNCLSWQAAKHNTDKALLSMCFGDLFFPVSKMPGKIHF